MEAPNLAAERVLSIRTILGGGVASTALKAVPHVGD
jgi:hypothetical protein